MKTLLYLVLGISTILPVVSLAAEPESEKAKLVTASFVEPEKFTDFNSSGFGSATEKDLKYLQEFFTEHLEKQAKRFLAPDQRLEVTFTDIDLAGRFEPERGPSMQNVRIYRDITYPRMVLTFRLLGADGQTLLEGERKLIDLNYNNKLRLPMSNDEFYHDQELLTDWMRAEFKRNKN
jgi:Protein of unknown function (DUF3016)